MNRTIFITKHPTNTEPSLEDRLNNIGNDRCYTTSTTPSCARIQMFETMKKSNKRQLFTELKKFKVHLVYRATTT